MSRTAVLGLALVASLPTLLHAQDCTGGEGIDEAVAFLASQPGAPPLPGNVCYGHLEGQKQRLAEWQPDKDRIVIDLDRVQSMMPGIDNLEERGGIMAVILYHELKHVDETYGRDICDDIRNTRETASFHANMILQLCLQIPGADLKALCEAYDGIADCFNNGCATEDGASGVWSESCPGTFPGNIPPSSVCDELKPDGTCSPQ